MVRLAVCLLAATYALESAPAHAAPSNPCAIDVDAPAIAGLADRLAGTEDAGAYQQIVAAAGALANQADGFSAADRGCAAYVAGSAAFFLSADRKGNRRHAAVAVGYYGLAEALAPEAMTGRQPRSRRRTAWQRLGAVPGWLRGRKPVAVAVPPGPAGTVRFGPADPAAWTAVCADCPPPVVAVPRGEGATSVSLRPGFYRIELVGRCGTSHLDAEVTGGLVPVPDPIGCTAQITARDGEAPVEIAVTAADGRTLDAAAAPVEASPVTVSAPGYTARTLELDPTGGALTVDLERCPVRLDVATRPPDARVDGAGAGPWGPRAIRATAPGHGPIETTVDVPRPARCDGARYATKLDLPRPVSVVAVDDDGTPVSIAALMVQGEPADVVGLFRPPGSYQLQARHPTLGAATASFDVEPCVGECGAVSVVVRFAAPDTSMSLGPKASYITGGVLMGVSTLAALAALSNHSQILAYETKAVEGDGLDDIIERRDSAALAADVFFVAGGVSLLTGYLWSRMTEDD